MYHSIIITGITESFDPICFYCWDSQLETNRDIEKLKENFAIVRPVCSSCYNKGMQPATRNAKKNKTTKDKLNLYYIKYKQKICNLDQ